MVAEYFISHGTAQYWEGFLNNKFVEMEIKLVHLPKKIDFTLH